MPETPQVFIEQFRDISRSIEEIRTITLEACRSLASLDKQLAVSRALDRVTRPDNIPADEQKFAQAEKTIELLQQQRNAGFPALNGMAVIVCWSEIEVFVGDLAMNWLCVRDDAWTSEWIRKLKVPLADFQSMSRIDRADWCVRQLQSENVHEKKVGLSHFEPVLEAIGLPGKTKSPVPQQLAELNAVRNLLAHRRGRIDKRFATLLDLPSELIGRSWPVRYTDVERYSSAVLSFAASVFGRVKSLYGDNVDAVLDFVDASEKVIAINLELSTATPRFALP